MGGKVKLRLSTGLSQGLVLEVSLAGVLVWHACSGAVSWLPLASLHGRCAPACTDTCCARRTRELGICLCCVLSPLIVFRRYACTCCAAHACTTFWPVSSVRCRAVVCSCFLFVFRCSGACDHDIWPRRAVELSSGLAWAARYRIMLAVMVNACKVRQDLHTCRRLLARPRTRCWLDRSFYCCFTDSSGLS